MGAVEEKGAVPKIKGYSGINPCWSERKDSQVKPSDLDGYVHDSEEAHTALGGFQTWGTNWMHRTPDYPTHPAAQANLGWFVIITWKFAGLLHTCEECCSSSTKCAWSHEFSSCVHWNATGKRMASFLLSYFAFPTKLRKKKLLLTEIHCQSLEVDLRESNSPLQGSKSQLVRSKGRSSHKHLKIESPVGSSPTEI